MADGEWRAIRERWASDPELQGYMEDYAVGLLPVARLRSLLRAGDYVALRTETERALAEHKASWEKWRGERATCPRCGGVSVHIAYGLPSREGREAARRGEIVFFGCVIGPNDPEWWCKACRDKWGRLRPFPPIDLQPTPTGT
jgi:hypothetical protein